MKSVLISIRPKWCEKIASEEKTIEVRKTRPRLDVPFKCYIYETQGATDTPFMDEEGHLIFKGRGQVIGEFVCDRVFEYHYGEDEYGDAMYFIPTVDGEASCLEYKELEKYGNGKTLYGWHISELVIYDEPKELGVFSRLRDKCPRGAAWEDCTGCWNCVIHSAPQSWMYVEELK